MTDETRPWFIYVLRDPRDGEVRYVGWTYDTHKRLISHISESKTGRYNTHKTNWIRSIVSQGLMPVLDIIDNSTGDNWQEVERRWIEYYRGVGVRLTNGTGGGDGNYNASDDTREKWRQARLGKALSDETKQRISDALVGRSKSPESIEKSAAKRRGRKMSDEQKRRHSERMRGSIVPQERRDKISASNMGRVVTQETRAKIGAANKGRKPSDQAIEAMSDRVICVETGTVYPSVNEAARQVGVSPSAICHVLKGVSETCSGYHWLYMDKPTTTRKSRKLERGKMVMSIEDGVIFKSATIAASEIGVTVTAICRAIKCGTRCKGRHWIHITDNANSD